MEATENRAFHQGAYKSENFAVICCKILKVREAPGRAGQPETLTVPCQGVILAL